MFITADYHFSHKKILEYQPQRPFAGVEEMDEALIHAWNNTVCPGDKVYHLGDFCFGTKARWEQILGRLNGSLSIINGNHDNNKIIKSLRESKIIIEYHPVGTILKVEKFLLHLTHYPMLIGCRKNLFSIQGHVHSGDLPSPDCINVGLDSRFSKSLGKPFGVPVHISELIPTLQKAETEKSAYRRQTEKKFPQSRLDIIDKRATVWEDKYSKAVAILEEGITNER